MVFRATLDVAKFVAECANLKLYVAPYGSPEQEARAKSWASLPEGGFHYCWMDAATFGGGCRLVYRDGWVWVSAHSGYYNVDCTQDVADFLIQMGATECDWNTHPNNPHLYGNDGYERWVKCSTLMS